MGEEWRDGYGRRHTDEGEEDDMSRLGGMGQVGVKYTESGKGSRAPEFGKFLFRHTADRDGVVCRLDAM